MKRPGPKFYSAILMSLLGVSGLLFIIFLFDLTNETLMSLMLNWMYLLMIISLVIAVVFPLVTLLSDIKKAKFTFIGLVALVVIFGLGYAVSGDETYKIGELEFGPAVSRFSEAGLFTFYILLALSVCTIIYAEVNKAFK